MALTSRVDVVKNLQGDVLEILAKDFVSRKPFRPCLIFEGKA
jgi:hypothetical protein